jgi:hypothetical protein
LNAPFDPADRDGGGTDLNWEKIGGSKLNRKKMAARS